VWQNARFLMLKRVVPTVTTMLTGLIIFSYSFLDAPNNRLRTDFSIKFLYIRNELKKGKEG
jgi:hypothetical protein